MRSRSHDYEKEVNNEELSEEVIKEVEEGEREVKEGKVKVFKNLEEAFKWLESGEDD